MPETGEYRKHNLRDHGPSPQRVPIQDSSDRSGKAQRGTQEGATTSSPPYGFEGKGVRDGSLHNEKTHISDFIKRAVSSSARAAVSISEREEIKSALFIFRTAVSDVEWDCERAIVSSSLV